MNTTYLHVGPFEIEEVEADNDVEVEPSTLRAPPIDLAEYRKSKEYREFWNDPCWTELPGPIG